MLDTAETDVMSVLAELEQAVDSVAALDLSALPDAQVTDVLQRLVVSGRRLDASVRHVVVEADRRGTSSAGVGFAPCTTVDMLRQLLNITGRDAASVLRTAQDLSPRVTLTGEVLPPLFPATATALDAGTITTRHAAVIAKTIEALPAQVEWEHGREAESFLAEQATRMDPAQLANVATRLTATLDPDGALADDADHRRRRDFRLLVNADGSSLPSGYLTPELTATLRPVLDALSSPADSDGGAHDARTAGQRRHDALFELSRLALRSGELPAQGGCPVTVVVTVTAQDLAAGEGLAEDSYGTLLPMSTVTGLLDDAELLGVTLNLTGGILGFGRSRRTATAGQRRALHLRDKGCSLPGCTRPAAWCEAHHIKTWLAGGGTDVDNLVLLCHYHHRHFEQLGWAVRMGADGVPDWYPPVWLDPERRPRRNTAHHTDLFAPDVLRTPLD